MDETHGRITPAGPDEELASVAEARSLQRKVVFWRRAAWLMAGLVVIVVVLVWKRADSHRHNCSSALAHYAELAQTVHLDQEAAGLLREQWRDLGRRPQSPVTGFRPDHYALIVENWGRTLAPGESLPMAVCASPHLVLFSYGRHVLLHDANGYHVEWYSEDRAAPIVRQAREEAPRK